MRLAMVFALVLIASCGDGSENGPGGLSGGEFSCRASLPGADGGADTPAVCIEISGGSAQDLATNRQSCAAQGAMFAEEPCPRAGALGGCRQTTTAAANLALTTWYYADGTLTAATVQELCEGLASGAPSFVKIQFVRP